MSDFHLILVLQFKIGKIINDFAINCKGKQLF